VVRSSGDDSGVVRPPIDIESWALLIPSRCRGPYRRRRSPSLSSVRACVCGVVVDRPGAWAHNPAVRGAICAVRGAGSRITLPLVGEVGTCAKNHVHASYHLSEEGA
jgi:hypothetical protein